MGNSPFCLHCGLRRARPQGCNSCGPSAPGISPEQEPFALRPGVVLKDQYQVGRVLGQGGFGITYIGIDLNLGMRVAIKEHMPRQLASRLPGGRDVAPLTRSETASFAETVERFAEEGAAIARLGEHPNIVQVLSFFRENQTAYLVMRYLDGQSLEDLLLAQPGGAIPEADAIRIGQEVLEGLTAVHREGLVHRDIKPANLFITSTGRVKLLDFGSARDAVRQAGVMTRMWTEGYAPLEQQRVGGQVGAWSDLYAVGATLYRALTGQDPPDATSERSAPLNPVPLRPPSDYGISQELSAVVCKALALSPDERYADAAEMQAALLQLSAGASPSAPTPRASRPPPPPTVRETVAPRLEPPRRETSPRRDDPPRQPPTARKSGLGGILAGLAGVGGVVVVLTLGCAGLGGLSAVAYVLYANEDARPPKTDTDVQITDNVTTPPPPTSCDDADAVGVWADARDAWNECRWSDAGAIYADTMALAQAPPGVQLCAEERSPMVDADPEELARVEDRLEKGLCHVSLPDYGGYNGALAVQDIEGFEIAPECETRLVECEAAEHEARKRDVEASERKLYNAVAVDGVIYGVDFREVGGDPWRWDIVVDGEWSLIFLTSILMMESSDPEEQANGYAIGMLAAMVMGEVGAESNRTLWVSRRLVFEEYGTCYGWITTAEARDVSGRLNRADRAGDIDAYIDALEYANGLMRDC